MSEVKYDEAGNAVRSPPSPPPDTTETDPTLAAKEAYFSPFIAARLTQYEDATIDQTGVIPIGAPARACSNDMIQDFMVQVVRGSQEVLGQSAMEDLKTKQKKAEDVTDKKLKEIKKAADKAAAARRSHGPKWLKWVARATMAVAAVIAVGVTAVSGGSLAFVGLAVLKAAYQFAGMISADAGGPDLTLSKYTKKLAALALDTMMSRKDAEKRAGIVSGAFGIASGAVVIDSSFGGQFLGEVARQAGADDKEAMWCEFAGTVAAEVGNMVMSMGLASGSEAAELSAKAQKLVLAAKATEATMTATNGASEIGMGLYGMQLAHAQHAAEDARIATERTAAVEALRREQVRVALEWVAMLEQQIQRSWEGITQFVKEVDDFRAQVNDNLRLKA